MNVLKIDRASDGFTHLDTSAANRYDSIQWQALLNADSRFKEHTSKTLTVLLIEDNPEYAALVERWLSLPGDTSFVLNWADSLIAGLYCMSQGDVDAIVLDLGLPESDGLSTFTTTRIHAAGVPIIVLSGCDDEAVALGMVQEGPQDYLLKSTCNRDVLIRAIQHTVIRYGMRWIPKLRQPS